MPRNNRNWMEIIATCRNSGLTDRQWCLENNIPISTFYLNVKKLREKACNLPASKGKNILPVIQDVVQLNVAEEEAQYIHSEHPVITLRVNGIHMDISNHASPAVITAALQAMVTVC